MTRLTVCWSAPSGPAAGPLLSFLPPAEEEALAARASGPFLRAREARDEDRAAARRDYLDVSARMGAVRVSGRTLRQECGGEDASAWWFHPSSFKDCESDPAFGRLLALRAILRAAEETGASELETWGAPRDLAAVLRGRLPVVERAAPWSLPETAWWLRAAASRAAGLAGSLLDVLACALAAPAPRAPGPRVLLLGYWDWSVREEGGVLRDRYHKALPSALAARGGAPGWLCWLDPAGDPARASRGRLAAARAAAENGVVLLQSFLDPGDALEAAFELRPLSAYLRRRGDPDFRAAFATGGLDLFPLFEERLLRGFLDGGLPRCELIRRAAKRACAVLRPETAVHFLEHFPHARAAFAGARAAGARTAAVQHASFCREKTFYFLDPALEFRGEPDGLGAPVPDRVFAMGRMGARHFRDCGYPAARVAETGSPRYDHVRPPAPPRARSGGGVRVLLAPALDLDAEAALLQAAAAASEGLAGVELRLRDHPFARLSGRPEYAAVAGRVPLSSGPLSEDLAWADVVLFTYSTVAEEAVLAGVPAWQWRPLSYDASALVEAGGAARWSSVSALRAALERFRPGDGLPDAAGRARLVEELFLAADGRAAERVADELYSSSWPPK